MSLPPPGRKRNRPLTDYAGVRFNRLLALRMVKRDLKWNDHKWLFRCDCGTEKVISIKSARTGHTKSCGCIQAEVLVARNKKHGLSHKHPREYRSWKDMRGRCNNPNDSDYADYGGRGITICPEWGDFAVFLADMGERPAGRTLDRIEVNGRYEKANCRWATATMQARNKRTSIIIEFGGVKRPLMEWCEVFGVDRTKVQWRLAQGWSLDAAFSREDYRSK